VAWSPNGQTIATAGDNGGVQLWKMNGKVPTADRVLPSTGTTFVAFSPDGALFVMGSFSGELTLYNTATWTIRQSLTGLSNDIFGVGFSPDSKGVVAGDGDTAGGVGELATFSIDAAAQVDLFNLDAPTWSFGVVPTGNPLDYWLGIGYKDGSAEFDQMTPGHANYTTFTPDAQSTWAFVFSPKGNLAATGGTDGVTKFWVVPPAMTPVTTGVDITTAAPVNTLEFSPSGNHIAIGSSRTVAGARLSIYDIATRTMHGAASLTYPPTSIAWSPSGTMVLVGEYDCGIFTICAD
jgi:WD40 repeat protein